LYSASVKIYLVVVISTIQVGSLTSPPRETTAGIFVFFVDLVSKRPALIKDVSGFLFVNVHVFHDEHHSELRDKDGLDKTGDPSGSNDLVVRRALVKNMGEIVRNVFVPTKKILLEMK
jgi:hypothetical protein